MFLYEHQGKELLKRFSVAVPRSILVFSNQALPLANDLGRSEVIIKSQVLSGRRGVNGGIAQCSLLEVSKTMERLSERLPKAHSIFRKVTKFLVEEKIDIAREIYLSLVVSREEQALLLLASERGGISIELSIVAKLRFNELRSHRRRLYGVSKNWKLDSVVKLRLSDLAVKLYRLLLTYNLLLVEINPLAITKKRLVIIDAKMESEFRLPSLNFSLKERGCFALGLSREGRAEAANLSYVQIGKGAIGCLANGAGLSLASIDMIAASNLRPLNFLDLKGKSSIKKVSKAMAVIASNNSLRSILVNIFGGIVCCGSVSEGLLAATATNPIIPTLLVRMEGTGKRFGTNALRNSNYRLLHVAMDFSKIIRGAAHHSDSRNV